MTYLAKIVREQKLNIWECATCQIPIALTLDHEERLRTYGGTFHCPVGHPNSWHGNTEVDRLRAKLADQTRTASQMAERARVAESAAQQSEEARAAASKELKRVKARVKAGVCPCCNRTFQQLARHMTTKHPEYQP